MGFSGLSRLPTSVRQQLAPGEEPLAREMVALAFGESRLGRPGRRRVITGWNWNPIDWLSGGPIEWDDGVAERWLGGVALTGAHGSLADRLAQALGGGGTHRLAITDRRVVLFREGEFTLGQDPATGRRANLTPVTELWSAPREAVRTGRRRSRLLMAGRFRMEFADDSTIALMCGVLSPRPANRLARALAAR